MKAVSDREFDLILYGASGFVGRQAVQYLSKKAPNSLRWAIGGRHQRRLDDLGASVPAFVAESGDQVALDHLAGRTRVLLNFAGPFALYGNGVVGSCIRLRTHYVDITGETAWMRALIDQYHERAMDSAVRIIPCCGFDAVPSDLGAYWIANRLQTPATEIKACFEVRAPRPNSGTVFTGLSAFDSGANRRMADPFLLNTEAITSVQDGQQDPTTAAYDVDLQTWVAPLSMSIVNTRIVRRSFALLGRSCSYQEFAKCNGRLHAITVAAANSAIGAAMKSLRFRQLVRCTTQPGTGPSAKKMDQGWFRCYFFGRSRTGQITRALMTGNGDPANRFTVQFACESALAIACGDPSLPERYGVLTPATGIGDALWNRMKNSGIQMDEIVEH